MVTLVVAALVAASAQAADKIEAKSRKARVECAAGNYTEGVRLLAELWVATGDVNYLYNQGRCYEQSGQNELAVSRFREYLRKAESLPAAEIEAVNKRIEELQRQATARPAPAPTVITLVQPAAPPPQAPPGTDRTAELVSTPQPAPVSDSPVYARWWFWTGVGAVVVGGVVTAVLLGRHAGQSSPACDPGVPCVR
jgi:tetratricopeptide (TPR) repeat protein